MTYDKKDTLVSLLITVPHLYLIIVTNCKSTRVTFCIGI